MHRCKAIALAGIVALIAMPLPAQVVPPQIEGAPEQVGADWNVSWESVPGAFYRLERSTDLKSWQPVDLVAAETETTTLLDDGTGDAARVFWRVVWVGNNDTLKPQILPPLEQLPDNEWRITWASVPGLRYILERSFDLEVWDEVETVNAIEDLTSLVDEQVAAGQPRAFWRVRLLGTGEVGVVLSDVEVSYQLTGDQPTVTYSVLAGGAPVQQLVIFDGQTSLGNARRTPGNIWTLTLPWDPTLPEPLSLEAEAIGLDGETTNSGTRRLLIADPSRFVPLTTDGTPRYGRPIALDAAGQLEAFAFYPEGFGNETETAGVRFEFAAGSRIETNGAQVEIVFDNGDYFNGRAAGGQPLAGSSLRLDTGSISPATIAALVPGSTPTLCWGGHELEWTSGTLGDSGWGALTLLPPFEVTFPAFQTTVSVGQDPATGELYLLICFHGSWMPLPDSGFFLEIPAADPLKIYLHEDGRVDAHGTAQATFPDGGTLRGHLSWRDPEFEFSFLGRGIALSAMGTLRDVLPTDPRACLPPGTTDSELDATADCLRGYQAAFKSLAQGALGQSAVDDPTGFPALPTPEEAAFATLRGWAGRAQSWAGDRSGQTLTTEQANDLEAVIGKAAKAAEAAEELATVLPALESLEVIKIHLATMAGASSPLEAVVDEAISRVIAAGNRLIEEAPAFALDDPAIDQIIAIDAATGSTPTPPPGSPPPDSPDNVVALANAFAGKLDCEIFDRYGFEPAIDPANPGPNPLLTGLPREELATTLVLLTRCLMVDQKAGLATDAVLSPPDKPYEEAYRQLRDELLAAHNAATSTAVGQRDYDGLRAILRERAGILGAYKLAGLPDLLSDSDFTPESSAVLAVFEGVVAQRLLNIDPDRRALHYLDNLQVVQKLAVCSSADLREHVEAFWVASSRFNSRFLHGDCEEFLDAFAERDIILPFLSESFEAQDSINISGKYEAIDDAVTLQVNQAGRYLLGWLQYHQREKYRLRGHYLDHDTGRISFRYLLINQSNDEIERTGVLNAVMIDGKPEITLGTVVDIGLGPDLREDTFLQTSNYPPLSPETIELFAGDGRDILLSHQLVPLHSLEVAFFYTKTPEIRTKITAFAQLPDGDINRNLRASETDALIGEILGGVDSASTALVRLALLQELSTDTVNDRTLREWLMIMVTVKAQANEPMTNAMALLGQVERISDNSDGSPSTGGLFRYEFSFEEISGGGDLGPIAVGGTVFEMTVEKYAPDGSFLDRFFYTGVMGQLGAGLGVPGAAFSEDAATVFSPIEYNAEDIEGKAMLFTATADIATPVGGSVNKTEFAFFGGEGIPPLIVDVSDSFADPNVLIGFEAGVGIEFGAGFVFDRTPVTQVSENFRFTQELAAFSAADDLEFQSSFDFGFDESNLTDCGRQYLREFVAEHRALFAIPDVHVAIFGFADTKGTETYNLGLSQDRANTVRNALLNILGGQLPIIPDNIAAIGLGEAPARIDLQGGDPDAPPWLDLILDQPEEFKWRSAALAAKDLSARIPDDTDDPEWRRAVIVLNGLVKISLESPLVDKP